MAILISDAFASEKEQRGYAPIFLVELLGIGRFYATQDPGFSGIWVAGQGMVCGSGFASNASLPEYNTYLHQLRNNGIGTMAYELDSSGFARTGQGSVSLLNQGFLNHDLQELLIENTPMRIRLGFQGLDLDDYVTVFKGVVDTSHATFTELHLSLVDDTLRFLSPTPPQVGADFFPRAFEQGKAIPIVLGDVDFVPAIQLIGPTEATLAFTVDSMATKVYFREVNATFPPKGEIQLTHGMDLNTVAYEGVGLEVINNHTYGVLFLTGALVDEFPNGSLVELVNVPHRYLLSFAGQNVRYVRSGNTHPTVAPVIRNVAVDPTGNDHRRVSVVDFAAVEQDDVTATIASEARGANLFSNGNFNYTDDGVTVVNGNWSRELRAGTFDYALRGRVESAQGVQSEAYIEATVEEGKRYRLTFYTDNVDADFGAVSVGTPASAGEYYTFDQITSTNEEKFELVFVAVDTTLRITMIVDNGTTPVDMFFDQFDLYDLDTENPAVQIEHLIKTHMRDILPNAASFAEARAQWDGERCAGIIQQTEEGQSLLGRIAQQFRAKTFLNEDGEQVIKVFDQSAAPVDSLTIDDVLKGSFSLSKTPLTEVYTHYFVYFGRTAQSDLSIDLGGRGAFSGVVFCTPSETNHSTESGLFSFCQEAKERFRLERTLEVFADMIPDPSTAEKLLSYLVRRGTHQRYVADLTTWLRAVHVEIGDFVRINHPLLPAASRNKRYEVVSKELAPNGCTVHITGEEINPFRFGGYVEHWEPVPKTHVLRRLETWEPPGQGAFNPYLFFYHETWNSLAFQYGDEFWEE